MKYSVEKLTALILAFLMVSLPLTSCSDSDVNKDTESQQTSDSQNDSESETFIEPDEPTSTYYNDMEAENFKGWTVNIAGGYGDLGDMDSVCEYLSMEALTGDEFNDALYNRIKAVDDKYNVDIVVYDIDDVGMNIRQSVYSGTGDYQLGMDTIESLGDIVGTYTIPLTSLENVDIDMPYWDKGAKESLMINGVMYWVLSDISFSHYDSLAILFYNGAVLEQAQIEESPYDLFVEGRWTMDNMYTMIEQTVRDLDGNGELEYGVDLLGIGGRDLRYQPQLNASGLDFLKWNQDEQTYDVSFNTEEIIAVGEAIKKLMIDSGFADMCNDDTGKHFKSSKLLFDSHLLGNFKGYRDSEDDFGVIPWPSLEENTEIKIYCRNPSALLIPKGEEHDGKTGTILSAMAAYGYDYITEKYISRTVIGKGMRDQKSAEAVRYMIDNVMYDVACSMNLETVAGGWAKAVANGSYASAQKKLDKMIRKLLKQALEPYEVD